jgi:acetolactate synthase-1/2/3 large subunit
MTESTEGIRKSNRRWQSDVIVDLVKRYGFPYVALNPGASYRGLHDSLVNYGENDPPILLCNHEKVAVQIAHGYARASGKPMIAIVHDVVGLLHAPMGIYYAYLDRVPVFIIGATGPLAEPKRRPFIDWIHSANVQGEAIRHIVKWDYQPAAIDGVPDAFARAYSIMMSGRQGPIYMCYDAGLQEAELDHDVPLPPARSRPRAGRACARSRRARKRSRCAGCGRAPCRHRGFRRQTAAWLGACDRDRRNIGCAGMGLQFSAQFSEQPSAQSQHGAEGVL